MKRVPPAIRSLLVAALGLLAVAGCKPGAAGQPVRASNTTANATPNAAPITAVPDKDRFKVTVATTGFFRASPLQPAGSDFDLKKDARLTMIRRGRGYSQIKTADGQTGFVGTEDIAPLAPGEIAQEDAATLQAAQAAAGAQLTGPLPGSSNAPLTTRAGKKSSAVEGSYTIPAAADVNTRLPEPDARAKATPTPSPAVNFR